MVYINGVNHITYEKTKGEVTTDVFLIISREIFKKLWAEWSIYWNIFAHKM